MSFLAAYEEAMADSRKGHTSTIKKKAEELWTLRELEAGDIVVANEGTSRVVGIGTVVEPGYEWTKIDPNIATSSG